jgi:Zn-dependent peptidase ImmA (M78 family)/transcriptional regulator with XRE-family HTH domain
MRVGTPGFVAARLTEGREARGLAQTALAELTGIKSQSISHYEQGRQSPSPESLSLLCEKLELPERYFLNSMPAHDMRGIFFRSARPHNRIARIQAERRLSWLREIAEYLRRHVDLPPVTVPDLPVKPQAGGSEIEGIADTCRQRLRVGFGPLTGLLQLLENAGCVVSRGVVGGGESEPSCSLWGDGAPCVLLNGAESPSRIRFDAAHELGHLVMHRGLDPEAHVDAETHRAIENQADHFARALLLPARTFGREVWAQTVEVLLSMKKEWNCPVAAMIARCGEIHAFDADQVRRAQVNLARRGWKAGEPSEDMASGETPKLLARGIRLMIDAGVRDRHSLLTDLCLPPGDIEQLAALPDGYFAECETQPMVALRLRGEARV